MGKGARRGRSTDLDPGGKIALQLGAVAAHEEQLHPHEQRRQHHALRRPAVQPPHQPDRACRRGAEPQRLTLPPFHAL